VIMDLVPENEDIGDFVRAGVAGFVLKEATVDDLVDTVRSVADGAHVLQDELTSPLFVQIAAVGIELDDDAERKLELTRVAVTLTARELQVVALLREGLGNKQIAVRLGISAHTVKSHVRSAMEKSGVHTRVKLAMTIKVPPFE